MWVVLSSCFSQKYWINFPTKFFDSPKLQICAINIYLPGGTTAGQNKTSQYIVEEAVHPEYIHPKEKYINLEQFRMTTTKTNPIEKLNIICYYFFKWTSKNNKYFEGASNV